MIFYDRPLSASAIELSLIAFSVECSCPLLFIVYIEFVVVFFFSMSFCASDAEITSVSSRPVTAPDCDIFSTNPLSKFNLSEKTFSLLFQNINPCKFVNVNSIPNNCNDSLILLHLKMRSLQKKFDNLYHFLSTFPTKPDVICISEQKSRTSLYLISRFQAIFFYTLTLPQMLGEWEFISLILYNTKK